MPGPRRQCLLTDCTSNSYSVSCASRWLFLWPALWLTQSDPAIADPRWHYYSGPTSMHGRTRTLVSSVRQRRFLAVKNECLPPCPCPCPYVCPCPCPCPCPHFFYLPGLGWLQELGCGVHFIASPFFDGHLPEILWDWVATVPIAQQRSQGTIHHVILLSAVEQSMLTKHNLVSLAEIEKLVGYCLLLWNPRGMVLIYDTTHLRGPYPQLVVAV
ncbi:uncharacterized protein BDV17DRAFT_179713 [Aspergillus undulatus]|uniref:uncharacterized protein n=1 Tax=Aspergillus undulatus TaxID=1810928 RepID=UPI003CCD135E